MIELKQEQTASYKQQTLARSFTCMGPSLHNGVTVIMTVLPAKANTGFRFIRTDVASDRNEVLASWHTVSDTHLSTTVSNTFGVKVSTVEHLIAALHASGVDNACIVLDGPEVPIMDGSAKPFIDLIKSVGLSELNEERKAIVITNSITVKDGNRKATFSASPLPWVELEIGFDSEAIGSQFLSVPNDGLTFERELADARTFGFVEQVDTLKKLGFARGGSLKNAVLVGENGVLNEGGLRHSNEFVRHKVLDCIGDLALVGARIIGCFSGRFTGHQLNNQLLRELMLNEYAYKYVPLRFAEQNWRRIQNAV